MRISGPRGIAFVARVGRSHRTSSRAVAPNTTARARAWEQQRRAVGPGRGARRRPARRVRWAFRSSGAAPAIGVSHRSRYDIGGRLHDGRRRLLRREGRGRRRRRRRRRRPRGGRLHRRRPRHRRLIGVGAEHRLDRRIPACAPRRRAISSSASRASARRAAMARVRVDCCSTNAAARVHSSRTAGRHAEGQRALLDGEPQRAAARDFGPRRRLLSAAQARAGSSLRVAQREDSPAASRGIARLRRASCAQATARPRASRR